MASLKTVRYEFPYPSQDDPVNIHTDIQALAQKVDDKIFADVIKTSDLGTNVATFLATPSSANLRTAVTDETGTGNLVFSTAPTFETRITISSAENNSIEIGRLGASSTPFIDFHSGATNIDYDSRIIANGGNGTVGQGNLSFIAADVRFTGTISFEGSSDDNFETTLTVTDPTVDRIITFPDATGTVALTSQLPGLASSSTAGLIELFSDTQQTTTANAVTSTALRTYGIQVNSDGQAVVNVPWTDTDTTYGIASSTVSGIVKLFSDTQQSVVAEAVSATNSRTYGIQLNASNQMVVNVPWVDTNTTYTAAVDGGLTLNGTAFSLAAHAARHEADGSDEIRGNVAFTDISSASHTVSIGSGGNTGYGVSRMNRITTTIATDIVLPASIAQGTQINFILTGANTNTVKFIPGTGATVNGVPVGTYTGQKLKLNGQYAVATAIKDGASSWLLFGNLTTV